MIKFLNSLVTMGTQHSSKSFSLIISVVVGALIGLCICFVILFDVIKDGQVNTSLSELGTLILCVGGYIAGGGVSKIMADKNSSTKSNCEKQSKTEEKG